MNTYVAFYKGKRLEVEAATSYEAQRKAAVRFQSEKKPWQVAVMLAAIEGQPVVHSTCVLG